MIRLGLFRDRKTGGKGEQNNYWPDEFNIPNADITCWGRGRW